MKISSTEISPKSCRDCRNTPYLLAYILTYLLAYLLT